MPATTLISTVGTSMFFPNLSSLRPEDEDPSRVELARSYADKQWSRLADMMARMSPQDRLCGAELNSLASLIQKQYVTPDANLFFCHSDTNDGRAIANILQAICRKAGHSVVEVCPIADLQDSDPRLFRTRGLRNLAKQICRVIRDYGAAQCAINATGGYKAQIAIAVMMGQAVHVPVYYKHERFDEIIAFPPMPVSLDFEVWMQTSAMLFDLEQRSDPSPASDWIDDWDDRCESLIERIQIDGITYLELSPAGQIFHETFRERFRSVRGQILPPAAQLGQKRPPKWEDSGHMRSHPEILARLQKITDEIPQVVQCATYYFNPNLPGRNGFRIGRDEIEGLLSNGKYTVKFRVETTAETKGQKMAMIACLNEKYRS